MAEALELQYRIFTYKLQEAITEDRKEIFFAILKDISPQSRTRISCQKIQGRSSFFVAVQLGRIDFVTFFINECSIDINELSTFEYSSGEREVTPLWIAVYNNDLEMVKLLVENEADVNATMEGGSTPVLVGCQTDAIEIVEYLAENGADFDLPDDNGITCLRESLDNEELCKFVVTKVADKNYHHPRQFPIIHCAINLKQESVVKLLIEAGCNAHDTDFDGNDALKFAAIQPHSEIVECIVSSGCFEKAHVIDSYELLSGSLFDKEKTEEGLSYMRKAMKLRFEDPENPILKTERERALVFSGIEEPKTMEDIEKMSKYGDDLRVQSLLVRERVLGPEHPDTLYKVLTYGMMLSYDKDYASALTILGYTYEVFLKKNGPLHDMVVYSMSQRIRLLYEIVKEYLSDDFPCPTEEILKAFDQLVEMIKNFYKLKMEDENVLVKNKKTYNTVLNMTLEVLYLIGHLKLNYDEDEMFGKSMNKLNQISPRNLFKQSLLHIAYITDAKNTRAVKLPGRQNWHPYLTEVFLQNGSDVNDRDVFKDTPLQSYLKNNGISPVSRTVVSSLLRHGAHIDSFNVHGDSALSMMRDQGYSICEIDYMTLKCLAARAIVAYNIQVPGYIPDDVYDFINVRINVKDRPPVIGDEDTSIQE
ncbi:hypothetical protein FSP39_017230 [Pinctada imbricata]|uniref:Uncharacterized protein n=1 Tax=Pinctada imbricata TaxID=66713 RepID=A0AA89BZJ8_PINIB|nr:hypothetical protein FSP39_017230 [Pinctada imbricata]